MKVKYRLILTAAELKDLVVKAIPAAEKGFSITGVYPEMIRLIDGSSAYTPELEITLPDAKN